MTDITENSSTTLFLEEGHFLVSIQRTAITMSGIRPVQSPARHVRDLVILACDAKCTACFGSTHTQCYACSAGLTLTGTTCDCGSNKYYDGSTC